MKWVIHMPYTTVVLGSDLVPPYALHSLIHPQDTCDDPRIL